VDGFSLGRTPCEEFLREPNVIQATRGYHPGWLSHYRASWIHGSDRWSVPTWPRLDLNSYLYGPVKPEFRSPLVLTGGFPAGVTVELDLVHISGSVTIAARADGREIARRTVDPADHPLWERDPAERRWAIYRARTADVVRIALPAPATRLEIGAETGDWVVFRALRICMPGHPPVETGALPEWGRTQTVWAVAADGHLVSPAQHRRDQPLRDYLAPWLAIQAKGEQIFVGEFGCYNKTPHPVALAWLEDWLRLWQEAGIGWAMWNFRGAFGPVNSERADVKYEDWEGLKLDRAMLDLLLRYRQPAR